MAPQASEKCGLLPTDHRPIASCTRNGMNSGKVRSTIFMPRLSVERNT